MEQLAEAFFTRITANDLLKSNGTLSRVLGGDKTNLDALIGLVRHYTYHLGAGDTMLRIHGLQGVY